MVDRRLAWEGGMVPRLVASVAAVSLLLLAVGALSAWYVYRLQKATSDLLADNVRSTRAAEELVLALEDVRNSLLLYHDSGEASHLDRAEELRDQTLIGLDELKSFSTGPDQARRAAGLDDAIHRFWRGLDRAKRLGPGAERADAARRLDSDVLAGALASARGLLDANEEIVERASQANLAMTGRVALVLLLLGVCGSVAGLVAGFGIARALRRSMVQLSVPILDAAGKLDRAIGPITVAAVRDVGDLEGALRQIAAEVGRVVERLEQSRRETLRSEQLAALGQLAAGLAHELRNPLTAMKMLVQAAVERGDASSGLRGRRLAVMEEEITRMDRTIQAFLDFARPPDPERRSCDLRAVIEQTATLLTGRAEAQGVRLETGGGPVRLDVDPGQIRQVVLNLAINALDETPEGGKVRLLTEHGVRGAATIRVLDDGPGLPPGLGERIFEPFVSTKQTGLGLGLPISARIVAAHGGTIVAADRPGGGAEFIVELPGSASCPPTDEAPLPEITDASPADRR